MTVEDAVATFAGAPLRWWIAGGHALEMHAGRSWRDHDDIDVGVCRVEAGQLRTVLAGWDVHVAAAGELRPWHGESLDADRHENNLWCRQDPDGPWVLDVTVGEGDAGRWVYRRDPSIELPWEHVVLRDGQGVPYLAPEVQLLYKAKGMRPKDDDARAVVPLLGAAGRARLRGWLDADHPWQELIVAD